VPIIRRNNCLYATFGTCFSEIIEQFKPTRPSVIQYMLLVTHNLYINYIKTPWV